MRRLCKPLAFLLSLVLILGLTGCGDSFEDNLARAASELQKVDSLHADMTLAMDMGMQISEGEVTSLPVNIEMSMDTAGTLTSGEMNMELLGIPVSLLYIVEQNGDAYDLYVSSDGSSWDIQTGVTAEELQSGDMSVNTDAGAMVDFYLEFASNFGEAVEETVNGVECLRYDGAFPGEKLTEALALSGGSEFAGTAEGAELPDAPLSLWLAKDSCLPARISLDMTEAMGQYMAGSFADAGVPDGMVTVNSITVTVDMSEYNSATPMTPPEA